MTGLVGGGARLVEGTTGRILSGAGLAAALAPIRRAYDALPPGVLFARTGSTVDSVLRYLAAMLADRPVALLDPRLPADLLGRLVAAYQPAAVVGLDETPCPADADRPAGYQAASMAGVGGIWRRRADPEHLPAPSLALLLATSGSTGNPRLVRLSRSAVLANALAIAEALEIDDREVAPTSLPLFYSYGLSVLNSHLVAGGTVVVADGDVFSAGFWRACDRHGATSLAGVPRHYEMLTRLRWDPARRPRLRTLTQAGGPLRPALARRLHERLAGVGGRLFLMYGQTEATARIAVLPPDRLPDKVGSAGLPVPGGRLCVRTDTGEQSTVPGVSGEVVYSGPNVMLGYADSAADLALGDELGGELATGDLGRLDDEGFLWLTGRLKRIGKVFGTRVHLDDVERLVDDAPGPVAAVSAGDRVVVWCAGIGDESARALGVALADRLRLHRSGLDVRGIDRLPTLANGKTDYRRLEAEAQR
ncbi:AMP-binding protein [Plantactinospora sp. CA-294935]|uniref:AMP-binding protein n=1 Tax=Plantactinospora sp. CA-294935 TaxID=3240012 RepID=UPI003D8CFF8E